MGLSVLALVLVGTVGADRLVDVQARVGGVVLPVLVGPVERHAAEDRETLDDDSADVAHGISFRRR